MYLFICSFIKIHFAATLTIIFPTGADRHSFDSGWDTDEGHRHSHTI